jgi:hypothetical protein
MAFVRDATALAKTATLERALHSVRLAKGQANASRVKEEDGKHPGSLPGLTAYSPMTNKTIRIAKNADSQSQNLQSFISSNCDNSCDLAPLSPKVANSKYLPYNPPHERER